MRNRKCLYCVLLAIALVLTVLLLPKPQVSAVSVEKYEAENWGELRNLLEAKTEDIYQITLVNDIYETYEAGSSGCYSIDVYGTKVLNLNGHQIICNDYSNLQKNGNSVDTVFVYSERLMFTVQTGADLTINDAVGGGAIRFYGAMVDPFASYENVASRDIFDVYGKLTINGGTFEAGNSTEMWIYDGREWDQNADYGDYDRYDGYAWQQVWGNIFTTYTGGDITINDGNFIGRGHDQESKSGSYDVAYNNEIIEIRSIESSVLINGGNFYAKGGAHIIDAGIMVTSFQKDMEMVKATIRIRGGMFKTETLDYVMHIGSDTSYAGSTRMVAAGRMGVMNIYDEMWHDALEGVAVVINGKTYTTTEEKLALNLQEVSGTLEFKPVDDDGFCLEFATQSPAMPSGMDTCEVTQSHKETTTYTFNYVPLTKEQIQQGYYIIKEYVLRNDDTKELVASKQGILGSDPELFTHTWNQVGRYVLSETLVLKNRNTGEVVREKSNFFYITVEKCLERLEVTTPPDDMDFAVYISSTGERTLTPFSPKGMVVTAYFSDGSTADVTKDVYYNRRVGDGATEFVLNYAHTQNGVTTTHKATLPVKTYHRYEVSVNSGYAQIGGLYVDCWGKPGENIWLHVNDDAVSGSHRLVGWEVKQYKDDKSIPVTEVYRSELWSDFYFTMPDTPVYATPVFEELDELHSVQIQVMPEKLSYYSGEYFDPTGLVLRAFFEGGTYKDVTPDDSYMWLTLDGVSASIGTPLQTSNTCVYVHYGPSVVQIPITVTQSNKLFEVKLEMTGYELYENIADLQIQIKSNHLVFSELNGHKKWNIFREDDLSTVLTSGQFYNYRYVVDVIFALEQGYENAFSKETVTLNGITAHSVRRIGEVYVAKFWLSNFEMTSVAATIPALTSKLTPNDVKVTLNSNVKYIFSHFGTWQKVTGSSTTNVSNTAKFEEGETYRVKLYFESWPNYSFTKDESLVSGTVNGEAVAASLENGMLVLTYEVTAAYDGASGRVMGYITSYLDDEPVTIELILQNYSKPAHTLTITGIANTPVPYDIKRIADGVYTIRVTKASHDVYTDTITITGGELNKHITLTPQLPATAVWVSGVRLSEGAYLAIGGTSAVDTKPSGGYAYFSNGELILHNYVANYAGAAGNGYSVFAEDTLVITLEGENKLTQGNNTGAIMIYNGKLTIGGTGKLEIEAQDNAIYAKLEVRITGGTIIIDTDGDGLRANDDIYLTGGTLTVDSNKVGINARNGDLTIDGCKVVVVAGHIGLYSVTGKLVINSGSVDALGGNYACVPAPTVGSGMKIQAATAKDGELVDYDKADFREYRRIVISPSALIGDFNTDGEVNDADAIYLLRYTLFPAGYPITQNGDVNSDGEINDADAIYMLRFTLFPSQYPLFP